jgi:hypothetical protein
VLLLKVFRPLRDRVGPHRFQPLRLADPGQH